LRSRGSCPVRLLTSDAKPDLTAGSDSCRQRA
jgi:hypothetical protein